MRPGLAASFLLEQNGRGLFIETGTGRSTKRLLDALTQRNLDPADVDYVIVTHVHLDHAGGAGTLLQALPQAKLVVHPRGENPEPEPEPEPGPGEPPPPGEAPEGGALEPLGGVGCSCGSGAAPGASAGFLLLAALGIRRRRRTG